MKLSQGKAYFKFFTKYSIYNSRESFKKFLGVSISSILQFKNINIHHIFHFLFLCCWDEILTKISFSGVKEVKGLFPLERLYHSSSLKETRTELKEGTWKQELRQETWSNFVYWLALHDLLILFSHTAQDHQFRMTSPTVCWVLSYPFTKMLIYLPIDQVREMQLLDWAALFIDD